MVLGMNKPLAHGFLVAAAFWAASPVSAPAADPPYQEVQHRESWLGSLFLRPAKKSPADQLAYARSLRDANRLRRARSHYHALVATWPAAPEAAVAQYEWARILEAQDDPIAAFDQYQSLIDRFPGRFDFAEVTRRQTEMAQRMATHRSLPFLFGGFSSPDRALPMYERILTNAPAWPGAPEIRTRMGEILESSGELAQAAAAYADVIYRHSETPWAEKAGARRIECLIRLSEKAPNNTRALDEAWAATVDYLTRFPASERASLIQLRRDALLRKRAEGAYEAARYYDRQKRKPEVIRTAYERFLAQYPSSPWTMTVKRRIEELSPAKEPTP